MTSHHLVVNLADDVGNGEVALFARDFRMKDHLEKEIAHLLGKFGVVAGIESIQHFVGFFNQIGTQRGMGLLAIPGTSLGSAQALLDGDEFLEPFASG